MKKNVKLLLALFIALSLTVVPLSGCNSSKGKKILGDISIDETSSGDDFDATVSTDDTASGGNESDTSATSQTQTTSSKSGQTTKPPGEDVYVDPNTVALPKLKVDNKTIKMLTRADPMTDDLKKILKDKYGASVSVQVVTNEQFNSTLTNLVASGQSPDIAYTDYYPSFVTRNLVQEIDSKLVDFNTPLWKGVKSTNDLIKKNDKNYYIIPFLRKYLVCWYNKTMFNQAGIKTPLQQYYDGTWNWDTFLEAAKKLTQDTNKDGTPEVYGYGLDEPELLLPTTGKNIISYKSNGSAVNNIESKELARFTAFNVKLHKEVAQFPGNGRLALSQGKCAMINGCLWYGASYGKQVSAGTIEFAPLPRDPAADKYYVAEEGSGWYIPVGAKNVTGAAAFLSVVRYINLIPEHLSKSFEELSVLYGGWNNDMKKVFKDMNEMPDTVMLNSANFNIGQYWGDLFAGPVNGISWSSIVTEMKPKIDRQIELFYQ